MATMLLGTAARANVTLDFNNSSDYITAPGDNLVIVSGSSATLSHETPFAGDGHLGPLVVTQPDTVLNVNQALQSDEPAGSQTLEVTDGSKFTANVMVAVVQMHGLAAVSGDQNIIVNVPGAGVFELVRIASVSGNTLSLVTPLMNGYVAASQVQVVDVPEYSTLTVDANASIVPPQAWDGNSGGVIAVASASGLQVLGAMSADGAGFLGGQPNGTPDMTCGVSALDDPNTPPHNGGKGESLAGFSGAGRGNLAGGGGGGDGLEAGGGGGGNGGRGGLGGTESLTCSAGPDVGGMGGTYLQAPPGELVTLGGGGGAGQQGAANAGAGGAGGGLVFVFSAGLLGSSNGAPAGVISARGAPGQDASAVAGAGGGGAGGSIYLLLANSPLGSITVDASGGAGGSPPGSPVTGPGGGGGGGRVFMSAGRGQGAMVAHGALSGANPNNAVNGAMPGVNGVAEEGGYLQLAMPANGEVCLQRLVENLDPNSAGGTVTYLLSRDAGADWEYFNGTSWDTGAGRSNAMDANGIAGAIKQFKPLGPINLRVFLAGNGNNLPALDGVTLVSCICGDSVVDPGEECDDGNQQSGDGCSSACQLETGYSCEPGQCAHTCGNSILNATEECDDGNLVDGDGCSGICLIDAGWICYDSPSTCAQTCGNGVIDTDEKCDDGNIANGDGCSDNCRVEAGWLCSSSAPSNCFRACGDLQLEGAETCDDGNLQPRDGCSPTCAVEPGWSCLVSQCLNQCGDGSIDNAYEQCDDGNTADDDGCSASCQNEFGWVCVGQPSHCADTCGNGRIDLGEQCDSGMSVGAGGCSASCQVQPGYTCSGVPSVCRGTCGDGIVERGEQCDQGSANGTGTGCLADCQWQPGWVCAHGVCAQTCGNDVVDPGEACDQGSGNGTGTGCSATCTVSFGYYCVASPSICYTICGDGLLAGREACDDDNSVPGDGCGVTCQVETGWNCNMASPTVCTAICGDGLVVGHEQCDSGAANGTGGCSSTCMIEPGYSCSGQPSVCTQVLSTTTGSTTSSSSTGSSTGSTSSGSSGPTGTGTTTGALHDEPTTTGSLSSLLEGQLGGGCTCQGGGAGGELFVFVLALWAWRRGRS